VTRFDADLEPDREAQGVCIAKTAQARLEAGWQDRVSLSLLPLWAAGRNPQLLQSCPDRRACWTMPADLDTALGEESDHPDWPGLFGFAASDPASSMRSTNRLPLRSG
jgi:hypothetical protein